MGCNDTVLQSKLDVPVSYICSDVRVKRGGRYRWVRVPV